MNCSGFKTKFVRFAPDTATESDSDTCSSGETRVHPVPDKTRVEYTCDNGKCSLTIVCRDVCDVLFTLVSHN